MNNVLITTYPEAFLHRGGGETELLDILHNLRLLGVKVDIYGPASQPLAKYDVVLHYSVAGSGLDFVRQVKKARKRLVLMPSIWWIDQPTSGELACVAEFFKAADTIVFKSRSEYENVLQYISLPEGKLAFCRWGVDSCFEEKVDADLFRSTHNLADYILSVGIIDERKNQLAAIRACNELKIPLVLMGDYRDRTYYEACVRSAAPTCTFLPYVQPKSEMLRSAIAGCKAFLEVSLEPCGFSALEAGLACVPLVLSQGDWTAEYFRDEAVQVDPNSIDSICDGLKKALGSTGVSPDLQRMIHNNYLMPQALEPLSRVLASR
jgi:glycosyltransferase involved in cell wall biosynthesis